MIWNFLIELDFKPTCKNNICWRDLGTNKAHKYRLLVSVQRGARDSQRNQLFFSWNSNGVSTRGFNLWNRRWVYIIIILFSSNKFSLMNFHLEDVRPDKNICSVWAHVNLSGFARVLYYIVTVHCQAVCVSPFYILIYFFNFVKLAMPDAFWIIINLKLNWHNKLPPPHTHTHTGKLSQVNIKTCFLSMFFLFEPFLVWTIKQINLKLSCYK